MRWIDLGESVSMRTRCSCSWFLSSELQSLNKLATNLLEEQVSKITCCTKRVNRYIMHSCISVQLVTVKHNNTDTNIVTSCKPIPCLPYGSKHLSGKGRSRICKRGAKVEAPTSSARARGPRRRRRRRGVWGGGVPQWGGVWGLGRGLCPFLRNFFLIWISKWWVLVHCGFYFFTVQLLVLHAKNGAFGLPRLAVACTAWRERERRNILVP